MFSFFLFTKPNPNIPTTSPRDVKASSCPVFGNVIAVCPEDWLLADCSVLPVPWDKMLVTSAEPPAAAPPTKCETVRVTVVSGKISVGKIWLWLRTAVMSSSGNSCVTLSPFAVIIESSTSVSTCGSSTGATTIGSSTEVVTCGSSIGATTTGSSTDQQSW